MARRIHALAAIAIALALALGQAAADVSAANKKSRCVRGARRAACCRPGGVKAPRKNAFITSAAWSTHRRSPLLSPRPPHALPPPPQ